MAQSDRINAALNLILAVGNAIQAMGQVPSGHLYARIMSTVSLDEYQQILGILKRTGLIREESSHLLVWTGPKKEDSSNVR